MILIWGSYDHGNFGDDLMAIYFAQAAREMGLRPLVYRLSHTVAAKAGVETVFSMADVPSGLEAVVIGGGALLCDYDLSVEVSKRHEEEVDRLVDFAEHRCVPVWAVSVGGSGSSGEGLTPAVKRLLSSRCFKGVSVRLRTDLERLSFLQCPVRYYPDVVLAICRKYSGTASRSGRRDAITIGVHLPDILPGRVLAKVIRAVGRMSGNEVSVVYFGTYLLERRDDVWKLGVKPELLGGSEESVEYIDPMRTVMALSQCSLLLSYKLHLGVSALGVGTEFLSFGGKGKTRAFMREIGRENACFGKWEVARLLKEIYTKERSPADSERVSEAAKDAEGHIAFFRTVLS